ncbi:MAG: methionyl-tRNA formyltransferase [Armatimonadota bacterium]
MARVIFFGSTCFSVPSLQKLVQAGHHLVAVVTQPDRPSGRGLKLQATPVKHLAEELGITVFQPERCRSKRFIDQMESLEPVLLVTAAFGQILPQRLLDAARSGYALNVHASLLPKYRGAAPIHRAIIDGEAETGVGIMQMVAKLDAGDVYASVSRPILPDYDANSLEALLADDGAKLLVQTINELLAGRSNPIPQDENLVTYAQMITRQDAFINWQQSAASCFRRMRAMSPKPGAEFGWNGRGVKLWQAAVASDTSSEPAGTVIAVNKQSILVACGDGCLEIFEVQPEGKARMSVIAWINGARVKQGDLLQTHHDAGKAES